MEAATPYTVTVMQAQVQGDIYSFQPCFLVDKGKERVGRWFVPLTGTAAAIAGARLGADTETLHEAMLRVGLDRLERELASPGGEQRLFGQNATQDCEFTADDLDELLGASTTDKACGYRHAEGRDLYCTAADKGDDSVIGSIGHRRAAPTSRPICNECSLPDARTLCSELAHPRVSAVETLGGYSRFLGAAWCRELAMHEVMPARCGQLGVPDSVASGNAQKVPIPKGDSRRLVRVAIHDALGAVITYPTQDLALPRIEGVP